MTKERTCFNCEHFLLCYLRRKIDDAIQYAHININSDAAPCEYRDIFETMGKMCLDFNLKKEK